MREEVGQRERERRGGRSKRTKWFFLFRQKKVDGWGVMEEVFEELGR